MVSHSGHRNLRPFELARFVPMNVHWAPDGQWSRPQTFHIHTECTAVCQSIWCTSVCLWLCDWQGYFWQSVQGSLAENSSSYVSCAVHQPAWQPRLWGPSWLCSVTVTMWAARLAGFTAHLAGFHNWLCVGGGCRSLRLSRGGGEEESGEGET